MTIFAFALLTASSGIFFLLGLGIGSRLKSLAWANAALNPNCHALVDIDSVLRSFFPMTDVELIYPADVIIMSSARKMFALPAPTNQMALGRAA